jgi:hypothetical protein
MSERRLHRRREQGRDPRTRAILPGPRCRGSSTATSSRLSSASQLLAILSYFSDELNPSLKLEVLMPSAVFLMVQSTVCVTSRRDIQTLPTLPTVAAIHRFPCTASSSVIASGSFAATVSHSTHDAAAREIAAVRDFYGRASAHGRPTSLMRDSFLSVLSYGGSPWT